MFVPGVQGRWKDLFISCQFNHSLDTATKRNMVSSVVRHAVTLTRRDDDGVAYRAKR